MSMPGWPALSWEPEGLPGGYHEYAGGYFRGYGLVCLLRRASVAWLTPTAGGKGFDWRGVGQLCRCSEKLLNPQRCPYTHTPAPVASPPAIRRCCCYPSSPPPWPPCAPGALPPSLRPSPPFSPPPLPGIVRPRPSGHLFPKKGTAAAPPRRQCCTHRGRRGLAPAKKGGG